MRLQQGTATRGMGFNGHFAQQQSGSANVGLGSIATHSRCSVASALLPLATGLLRHGKRRSGQTCRLVHGILPFIAVGMISFGTGQMAIVIGRRKFIGALGGAAAAWPFAASAQQLEQMRRIGVLMNVSADDPEGPSRLAVFQQALQQLGWSEGRNVRIDIRFGANDVDRDRTYATELATLGPDVILAGGTLGVSALQRVTHTIPIVFVGVSDPVGAGLVDTLARPGGNVTGFMLFEYSLSGKWVELLKEIAPGVTRAAVLRDAAIAAGAGQFAVIQAVAPAVGVEVSAVNVLDAAEIERAVAAFARSRMAV
jgi:ABC-type uncharacterized transport system substrate-binding protein